VAPSRNALLILLSVITLGALAFRLPRLSQRVMHQDEAIHADKCAELWKTHRYDYDPDEYHGPTLNYFTLPVLWLSSAKTYAQTSEWMYRLVPVLFGAALVMLLFLVRDGMRVSEQIAAGVLTAISPAMVYYSRYYIQEMLLVFFTFAAMGCGYRYARSGRWGWCIACGAMLGMMYATKETWVIAAFCMLVALGVALYYTHHVDDWRPVYHTRLRRHALPVAPFILAAVAAIFFSAFFTNWSGPLNAIKTYAVYFGRGKGGSEHNHPTLWYLSLLSWHRYADNPRYPIRFVRSELIIELLALVGILSAMLPAHTGRRIPRRVFGRFLSFYTIAMVIMYSLIPYKTPWCLLGFLHGMILLAGIGAAALIRWTPYLPLKALIALLMLIPVGQLAWQSYDLNFINPANGYINPYVYALPSSNFMDLVKRLNELAAVSPAGRNFRIQVVTKDCWPLPWYLRTFGNVDYWDKELPKPGEAAILIAASPSQDHEVSHALGEDYDSFHYGLRRGVVLSMYVERELWQSFLKHQQ